MNKRAGYTYDVHENCLIFKIPQPHPPPPPPNPVHLRPKFSYSLDLGHPILNEPCPTVFNKLSNNNRIVHVGEQNQLKIKPIHATFKLTMRSIV